MLGSLLLYSYPLSQAARACFAYPVTYYNLNIGSSDVNQPAMVLGPYISDGASQIEITLKSSDGIHQNARYNFQIVAVNIIGSSNSNEMVFCKSWTVVTIYIRKYMCLMCFFLLHILCLHMLSIPYFNMHNRSVKSINSKWLLRKANSTSE